MGLASGDPAFSAQCVGLLDRPKGLSRARSRLQTTASSSWGRGYEGVPCRSFCACPDNRLVADSLEAEWNTKLRALAEAQQEYERQLAGQDGVLNPNQRRHVMALATDFPRLWRDPATPQRERKRMVRGLLTDVTLRRDDEVVAQIRFRGGATQTIGLP
jgi:hypothetical protein